MWLVGPVLGRKCRTPPQPAEPHDPTRPGVYAPFVSCVRIMERGPRAVQALEGSRPGIFGAARKISMASHQCCPANFDRPRHVRNFFFASMPGIVMKPTAGRPEPKPLFGLECRPAEPSTQKGRPLTCAHKKSTGFFALQGGPRKHREIGAAGFQRTGPRKPRRGFFSK